MTSRVWVGVSVKNPFDISAQKERGMKEMNYTQSVTFPNMQRDLNIEGLPVLRELAGPICAHCGSLRYFLVFRVSTDGRNGILAGRCSRCRNPRELTAREIERGCHD